MSQPTPSVESVLYVYATYLLPPSLGFLLYLRSLHDDKAVTSCCIQSFTPLPKAKPMDFRVCSSCPNHTKKVEQYPINRKYGTYLTTAATDIIERDSREAVSNNTCISSSWPRTPNTSPGTRCNTLWFDCIYIIYLEYRVRVNHQPMNVPKGTFISISVSSKGVCSPQWICV